MLPKVALLVGSDSILLVKNTKSKQNSLRQYMLVENTKTKHDSYVIMVVKTPKPKQYMPLCS